MDVLISNPLNKCPTSVDRRLEQSSKIILTPAYELHPWLIKMVQSHSFLGKEDENPYLHLREFEQTCDCLRIEGMFDEILGWKLFPFCLKDKAKTGTVKPYKVRRETGKP